MSVITLAKGRAAHLRNLVQGLTKGTRLPTECIVVSLDQIAPALDPAPFPIILHQMPSDGLPLAAARNAGAERAASPTLIFLDVDCIPASNLVEALVEDAAQEDALICCEVLYLPASAAEGSLDEADMVSKGVRHDVRDFPLAGRRGEANAGLFWSLAFAVRQSTFQRIGRFDEAFTGYGGEDTDFAFRAKACGVPLVFSGSTRAFHQHHPVYDPPLHHFADIVANSERFRARHGFWPMDGWLNAFADMGLLEPLGDHSRLRVIRSPSDDEIAASACPAERAY